MQGFFNSTIQFHNLLHGCCYRPKNYHVKVLLESEIREELFFHCIKLNEFKDKKC